MRTPVSCHLQPCGLPGILGLVLLGTPLLFLVSAPAWANPLPAWACCLPDGTCTWMPNEQMCEDMEGVFMGDGVLCDPNPCSPLGACCDPDGSCIVAMQSGCTTGAFHPATSCNPNPCPPCLVPCGEGACCTLDGHCLVVLQGYCEGVVGGEWQGAWTPCTPDPCATSGVPSDPGPQVDTGSWGKIKQIFR